MHTFLNVLLFTCSKAHACTLLSETGLAYTLTTLPNLVSRPTLPLEHIPQIGASAHGQSGPSALDYIFLTKLGLFTL